MSRVPELPITASGVNLIYYSPHTALVDRKILELRPQYLIGNTPHGLWGEISGYDAPWLLHDSAAFQQAGIEVFGYLTSGYENRGTSVPLLYSSLATNEKIITNLARVDQVAGVFIDECTSYPDVASRVYLKTLTDLIHSLGLKAWGNVGHDDFDEWYFTEGGFDLMNASENWRGQALTPVQQKWGARISVTGFDASYGEEEAYRLTRDAWDKGLGFAYISNDEYATIPGWLPDLLARFNAVG